VKHRAQVVVVGAGPAGLVTAILLGRYGIDVLVVEKRPLTSNLARAVTISTRSMEIFRAWGLDEPIRRGAADVEPLGWETPALASGEGRTVALGYPTVAEASQISPTRPAWAPQDHLEPLLLDLVGSLPTVEVRFGCELFGLRQGDGGVLASVRVGGASPTAVAADQLVGADGAHSCVRRLAGIGMQGPDNMGEFHRVEFRAPLTDILGPLRYGLYIITNPEVAGVVSPQGAGDRWMLARDWRGGDRLRIVDADESQLRELLAIATGVPHLPARIESTNAFFLSAQLADRYREGRVFLVGDAAHRMTPRGATGMNTGIQDAFDIGWKLAWVLLGWSGEALLDTYEAERMPVGRHNVHRAAQPDGARRDAKDALPWDLYGRLAHRWVDGDAKATSTLDLLGEGFTLLTGPDGLRWPETRTSGGWRPPLAVRRLDRQTADLLAIAPSGATLVRPDGKTAGSWRRFTPEVTPHSPLPRASLSS
jgi:2-polyprenyl-6-methoxyphenol hydroxylase-like FAD-dependent oxidoreductase